jgi:hypothetical protein
MRSEPARTEVPAKDHLTTALVRAAATARWPAGALLLDLGETIIHQLLAPRLIEAVQELATPPTERHGER